jgi:methionyl-tRNA formyltransferase
MSKSAVKEFAESNQLEVLQPQNLKDPEFIERVASLKPDVIIVVAFRMLPAIIWKLPSIGTFNLHASLLPQYRGAAPINHAIINGETVTGVTTFFIDDKIDTGNILLREEIQIYPFENAGDLHDKLMIQGARLVIRTLEGLVSGELKPRSQTIFVKPGEVLRMAPKIFPDNCIINWKSDTASVQNLIRGLSPYPCAKSTFLGNLTQLTFKIFESQAVITKHNMKPGDMVTDGRNYIRIACNDGFIDILNLQLEGKKRMVVPEFLRGFRINDYTIMIS